MRAGAGFDADAIEDRWAAQMVLSRSYDRADGEPCLVPFVDLANHAADAPTAGREDAAGFVVTATAPIAAGEEARKSKLFNVSRFSVSRATFLKCNLESE